MDSIKQTRFFTQNYPQLQGLRAVPSGLYLLFISLWDNLQRGSRRDLSIPILVALACLLLYIVIAQYYNRVYGRVKRMTSRAELFLQAACGVVALAAFIIDTSNATNISLLGLVFAAVFAITGFWYWRPATVLFALNLVLAVVFMLLSLSPLVGIQNWWNLFGLKNSLLAFSFLFGLFGVIGGVILHVYFTRALPASQESS